MDKITTAMLERSLGRLNILLGAPLEAFTTDPYTPNDGNIHIASGQNLVKLERVTEGGGSESLTPLGTKRQILEHIQSMTRGVELAQAKTGTIKSSKMTELSSEYAMFNGGRHLCVNIPDGHFTISTRTNSGKKVTFAFVPYRTGEPKRGASTLSTTIRNANAPSYSTRGPTSTTGQ